MCFALDVVPTVAFEKRSVTSDLPSGRYVFAASLDGANKSLRGYVFSESGGATRVCAAGCVLIFEKRFQLVVRPPVIYHASRQ